MTGPKGPKGKIGPAGADGATGSQGPQGKIGPAANDGADGSQGPQGKAGPAGNDGAGANIRAGTFVVVGDSPSGTCTFGATILQPVVVSLAIMYTGSGNPGQFWVVSVGPGGFSYKGEGNRIRTIHWIATTATP